MGNRIKRLGIWMGWLILFKAVAYGLLLAIPAIVALVRPPEAAQAFRDTLFQDYRGWFNLAPLLLFVFFWRTRRLPGLRDAPEEQAATTSLDNGPAVMARRGAADASPAPVPARKKATKPARQPFTAKRWHTYQLDADLFSAICASPCGCRMLYVSHAMMTSQGAHCMAILTKEDFPKRAATKLPAITCTPNRVENGRTKPRQTKRHTCPGGICPLLNSLGSLCGNGLMAPRRGYYQRALSREQL